MRAYSLRRRKSLLFRGKILVRRLYGIFRKTLSHFECPSLRTCCGPKWVRAGQTIMQTAIWSRPEQCDSLDLRVQWQPHCDDKSYILLRQHAGHAAELEVHPQYHANKAPHPPCHQKGPKWQSITLPGARLSRHFRGKVLHSRSQRLPALKIMFRARNI